MRPIPVLIAGVFAVVSVTFRFVLRSLRPPPSRIN